MNYSTKIYVDNQNEDLFDLFKEQESAQDRSSVTVEKENNKLMINIKAKDSTALRAAFNSITKLFTVYEGVENGKRN